MNEFREYAVKVFEFLKDYGYKKLMILKRKYVIVDKIIVFRFAITVMDGSSTVVLKR